jgi:hypothetical protein
MKLLSFEPSNDGLEIQSVVVHVLEVEQMERFAVCT